jgi:glycosyltransferase involved in cell wall biosynthesis
MGKEPKSASRRAVKERELRVVLIGTAETVSDYSVVAGHLLAGLAGESIASALVCPLEADAGTVASPSTEVIRYPAFRQPLLWRQDWDSLAARVAEFRPTVLHCLSEKGALLVRWLSRVLGVGYVLSVNSFADWWGQYLVSKRRCLKIIVPSRSIAFNAARAYGQFSERVELINPGTFVETGSGSFREDGGPCVVATAHRPGKAEDFRILLGAARHLALEGYEFMVVILGDGRGEKKLRSMIKALGLTQKVAIVPRLSWWRSALAAGDIFVQPVVRDSFNPYMLEAMGVGAAVAGCRGGVDDLLIEDRTAVLFEADDEFSMKGALQRLLESREFARRIATGAQRYLKENHSVSNMVSSFLRVYLEAQSEGSGQ